LPEQTSEHGKAEGPTIEARKQVETLAGVGSPKSAKTKPIKHKPLWVEIRINSIKTYGIIDTGSGRTIFSKDIIKFLEDKSKSTVALTPTKRKAQSLTGQDLQLLGQTTLSLEVANIEKPTKFLVANNINIPVIIGLDVVKAFKLYIDVERNKISSTRGSTAILPEKPKETSDIFQAGSITTLEEKSGSLESLETDTTLPKEVSVKNLGKGNKSRNF